MSNLRFTCSYTKLSDVAGESPCGRPATRRPMDSPKCLGHWVTDYLMDVLGRREHARKTWWFASMLLLVYSLMGVWMWSQSYNNYLYLTWALTIFSTGLLIVTAREHPLGGLLALGSAPVIAYALLENASALMRAYLFAKTTPPAGESRLTDNLMAAIDLGTGIIFLSSFMAFVFFYRTGDRRELTWWTFLNPLLAALVLPCIIVVSVLTDWQYLDDRPWLAVVYVAALVARGADRFKDLVKGLRV